MGTLNTGNSVDPKFIAHSNAVMLRQLDYFLGPRLDSQSLSNSSLPARRNDYREPDPPSCLIHTGGSSPYHIPKEDALDYFNSVKKELGQHLRSSETTEGKLKEPLKRVETAITTIEKLINNSKRATTVPKDNFDAAKVELKECLHALRSHLLSPNWY